MVGPSSSEDMISRSDLGNPLHLQNSDFNANTIIFVKLTETKKYRVWAAAIKLAINTRNKIGFIDGPKQSGPKTLNENSDSFASSSSKKGTTLSFTNEHMMKLISLINEAPTRLGHPSDQAVDVLQNELNFTRDSKVSLFDIYYKAKQTKEAFPISDHQTTSIGEIVHLDMWGPYKAYKVYSLESKLVSYSRDIKFYETIFPFKMNSNLDQTIPQDSSNNGLNNLNLFDERQFDNQSSSSPYDEGRINSAPNDNGNNQPCTRGFLKNTSHVQPDVRSSSRTVRMPAKFNDYVSSKPTSYSEAIKNPHWIEAMNNEIEALNRNNTCTIYDLPAEENMLRLSCCGKLSINHQVKLKDIKPCWLPRASARRAYVDSDWDRCPTTGKSISGYYVFLGLVACCDNSSALQIATNPVFHEKSKHFEIDVHLVREKVASSVIKTKKIHTFQQIADLLTKALDIEQHKLLCEKIVMLDMFKVEKLKGRC
uniref:Ribonuclease H-like domain-containing protein n=1 Tax=Tanacetum cinerariifolium TaxID=118510 RepID=A0A699GWM9_TANCI|nr:ribonuclease H-like domain-containing protein [Tanacetum cinerariifolium]